MPGLAAEDDEFHDGGALKGESILITGGPHRKKKGHVTGGGHGFYLIELSGREKGIILKRPDQFKHSSNSSGSAVALSSTTKAAATSTKSKPEASPQSSRSSSRASGRASKQKHTDPTDTKVVAADGAAVDGTSNQVTSVARSRPRRTNAGVNTKKTDPGGGKSSSSSSKGGGESGSDDDEPKPTTPAAKAAYRNKEKIKAKLRAIQNNVLKRSKRSTKGSRYSRSGLHDTSNSNKPVSYQLSDREREREEWRAIYELQVEQYHARVQKQMEVNIERERLEPRPDVTTALIRIEKSWNHDDGRESAESSPTYEWETNDPNIIDLEPEERMWSKMTSFRRGIDIVAKDGATCELLAKYQASAPVIWLGDSYVPTGSSYGTTASEASVGSSSSSPPPPLSSSFSKPSGAYNLQEDWQAAANDHSNDDMCAYDWIQSRMKGGVEWFYPKGKTTHVQGQFIMEQEGRATLEPSPVYGMHLEGEQAKFGNGMYHQ